MKRTLKKIMCFLLIFSMVMGSAPTDYASASGNREAVEQTGQTQQKTEEKLNKGEQAPPAKNTDVPDLTVPEASQPDADESGSGQDADSQEPQPGVSEADTETTTETVTEDADEESTGSVNEETKKEPSGDVSGNGVEADPEDKEIEETELSEEDETETETETVTETETETETESETETETESQDEALSPAVVSLTAQVSYPDHEMTAGQFTFYLKQKDVEDGANVIATNDENGAVDFGDVSFDEPGEYTFRISQKNGGKTIDRIQYDGSVYNVHVTVEEGEDGLTASVDKKVSFVNTYDAKKYAIVFRYEDDRVSVFASASDGVNFPEGTELHADYLAPGSAAYREAAAVLESAYSEEDLLDYILYDIYFTEGQAGDRLEPEDGTVKVSMSFKQPVLAQDDTVEVQAQEVVHVQGGSADVISSKAYNRTDGVTSVSFTSGSFSPYGIALLGNEDPYGIMQIDSVEPQDIKDLLSGAEISPNVEADGKIVIEPNTSYTLKLQFAEEKTMDGKHFAESGIYTYQLPEGFPVQAFADERELIISISDKGVTYDVHATYSVGADGKVTIKVDPADPNFEYFKSSTDVQFGLEFRFQYSEKKDDQTVQFSDKVEKELTFKSGNYVGLEKTASFDEATGKVTYTVKVKSKGHNDRIKVKDTFSGDLLHMNEDVEVKDADGRPLDSQPPVSYQDGTGFELTIPEMEDEQEYIITYTADVDYSKVSGDLYWSDQTKNTITAQPEGGDETSTSQKLDHLSHVRINKSAGDVSEDVDREGNRTIPWTIEINADGKETIKDNMTVHDSLGAGLHYSGDGLQISVDGDTITVRWAELGIDDPNSVSEWTISDLKDLLQNKGIYKDKAKVTIAYNTVYNVKDQVGNQTVTNNADYDSSSGSGTATVPGVGDVELEKKVTDQSDAANAIEWKITYTVTGDVSPCVLTDTLPTKQIDSEQLYDELLEGSLTVEGLCEKEHYELNTDETGKLKFHFYTDTDKESGIKKHDGKDSHVITITYKTKTNAKWLTWLKDHPTEAQIWQYVHTNSVTDGKKSANAEVSVYPKDIEKKVLPPEWNKEYVDVDGVKYPLFHFGVILKGVDADSMTFEDLFDASQLQLYDEADFEPKVNATTDNGYNYNVAGGTVSYVEETGKIDFTVQFNKPESGGYYSAYRVDYWMIPKDPAAMKLLADGNRFKNEAVSGSNHSEVEVDWSYSPLSKKVLFSPNGWNSDLNQQQPDGVVTYKIDINPSAIDLVEGSDELTVTDKMTNLRFLPDTLKIKADGADLPADAYHFDYSGDTLTITLPNGDGKHIEITYDARVLGKTGESVTVSNEATVTGVSDSQKVEQQFNVSSSGSGHGSLHEITLLKYRSGFMRQHLNGAKFGLYYLDARGEKVAALSSSTGMPLEYTTDIDGKFTVHSTDVSYAGSSPAPGLYEDTQYYLIELEAPKGYTNEHAEIPFKVSSDGETGKDLYFWGDTIYAANDKELFHILKVDEDDAPLAGAAFSLYGEYDGSSLTDLKQTIQTDGDGRASFNDLSAGTYYLQETKAPDGYKLPDPNPVYRIVISDSGEVTSDGDFIKKDPSDDTFYGKVVNEEAKGSLKVEKVATGLQGDDGNDKDYKFTVKDESGKYYNTDGTASVDEVELSVKAGSSVTLENLPVGKYTVTENRADAAVDNYALTVKDPENVQVTKDAEASATITNTYTQDKGSLKVEKVATGLQGDDGNDKDYKFTVKDESGKYYNTDGTASVDEVELSVKAGSSVTLENLPVGKYTVTENRADAAVDNYTLTVKDPENVQVTKDAEASATITNTYTQDKGSLKVEKVATGLQGDDGNDKDYKFTVKDESGKYYNTDGTASVDEVELSVKAGSSVTLENLPVGKYTVTENRADAAVDNYALTVKDPENVQVTKDAEASATITNTYTHKKGELSVKKTVEGGDSEKEFNFTVTLSDSSINGEYGEMYFESGVAHFTLKDGETKTATGLPSGISYTVEEEKYENYTTDSSNANGEIVADTKAEVTFVNTYNTIPEESTEETTEESTEETSEEESSTTETTEEETTTPETVPSYPDETNNEEGILSSINNQVGGVLGAMRGVLGAVRTGDNSMALAVIYIVLIGMATAIIVVVVVRRKRKNEQR